VSIWVGSGLFARRYVFAGWEADLLCELRWLAGASEHTYRDRVYLIHQYDLERLRSVRLPNGDLALVEQDVTKSFRQRLICITSTRGRRGR
jgi:hypothetical protein